MAELKIKLTFPDDFDLENNENLREWMASLYMQCRMLGVDAQLWIDGNEVEITLLSIINGGSEPS